MLLDMDLIKSEQQTYLPQLTWQEYFRQQIIAQHNSMLDMQIQMENKANCYEQSQAINNLIFHLEDLQNDSTSQKELLPFIVEFEQNIHLHQDYSNFVPITKRCYDGAGYGQCEKQFPYAYYVKNNDYKVKEEQFWADLQKSVGKVNQFRAKMCQKYNPEMNFTQKLDHYIKLLCYGTKTLEKYPHKSAMLYNLTKYHKYLDNQQQKTKNNISITIQKQQEINPKTISYTMKTLYCPICFVYDCPVHTDHQSYINSQRLEFVSPNNKIDRCQHIQSAIKMLDLNNQICGEKVMCSEECCLRMGELSTNGQFIMSLMARQTAMSSLTKALIQLGLCMFSYNPCLIRKLLPGNQTNCCQIYKYLETQLNILLRINNKMHSSEYQSLLYEQTLQKTIYYHHLVNRRRKKNKPAKSSKNKKAQAQSSICVHHFLNQPSVDENCANCICNQRGFCTTACLCTNQCPILKVGCRCKKNKNKGMSCKNESCSCYQANIECDPAVCGKCCTDQQGKCMNRQIQTRKLKRCFIGPSTIPGGGFGLFAGQNIEKDSLVTIYLGQMVSPQTSEFRQLVRKNNSFYNFEQKDTYLDSRFIGNKSRFINHNTFKYINLKVREVKSLGELWTAFYATKDIYTHEQLFFNYDGDGQIAKNHADKYPFIRAQ